MCFMLPFVCLFEVFYDCWFWACRLFRRIIWFSRTCLYKFSIELLWFFVGFFVIFLFWLLFTESRWCSSIEDLGRFLSAELLPFLFFSYCIWDRFCCYWTCSNSLRSCNSCRSWPPEARILFSSIDCWWSIWFICWEMLCLKIWSAISLVESLWPPLVWFFEEGTITLLLTDAKLPTIWSLLFLFLPWVLLAFLMTFSTPWGTCWSCLGLERSFDCVLDLACLDFWLDPFFELLLREIRDLLLEYFEFWEYLDWRVFDWPTEPIELADFLGLDPK